MNIEGILTLNDCNRFEIQKSDKSVSLELTSGATIEVDTGGGWVPGRIEHIEGAYVLLCQSGKIRLRTGLKARIKS